jgi:hypothetical protein
MITTNTASASLPATYVKMREKCEQLLEIAEQLERISGEKELFFNDPEFEELKNKYNTQFGCLSSFTNL